MKTILFLCLFIFLTLCAGAIAWTLRPDHYGEPFAGYPSVPLDAVLADPTPYLEKSIRLQGTVSRQCALTGCFFFFALGEKRVRIEVSDLATLIPQRRGYRAQVEGTLIKHYDEIVLRGRSVSFFW